MNEIAERVFEKILKSLDDPGAWSNGRRGFFQLGNPVSRSKYHGINTLILSLAMMEKGYEDPRWCTMRQSNQIGTHIRKGEGKNWEEVIFWKMRKYKVEGEDEDRVVPMLRSYRVYNFAQLAEIPEKYAAPEVLFEVPQEPQALVDSYLDREGIDVVPSHGSPYYAPLRDTVGMPPVVDYLSPERYFESFFHECIHSTGHVTRLDRPLEGAWNKDAYSREELVAEFGTAFLLDRTGLGGDLSNLAAYIKSWHKAIKEHPKDLIVAAGHGERAVEYFLGEAADIHKEEAA
jgi:antirestriction protein ArdC